MRPTQIIPGVPNYYYGVSCFLFVCRIDAYNFAATDINGGYVFTFNEETVTKLREKLDALINEEQKQTL